jgi:O-antigen/teichoic acid export membrane protein
MTFESLKTMEKDASEKTILEDRDIKAYPHTEELVQLTEGTGIIFIGKMLERAILYLYTIMVARMLGKESFGLLMLGLTILYFAGSISRFGLDGGVLRFIPLYNGLGDKSRVKGVIVQSLKYTFTISIIIGAGLFFAAKPLLVRIFNKPELEIVVKLLCLSLPFLSLMTMALTCTRGLQVMRYTVYGQSLFRPICELALVTILFIAGFRLRGILVARVVSFLLASVLSLYFVVKTFPEIRRTKSIPESRELLRFSLPLLLTITLNFLVAWTDTLMLGYFRSAGEVGVYNAALRTAMLTSMVLLSFTSIFAPMISDLYSRRELHKLQYLFGTTAKWMYTISLPVFLLMVLLSKEIMAVFGQEFLAGGNCLVILAFAQLVNTGVGCVVAMLVMSGKQDLMMYNTLGISLLNILLNYLLIPAMGILGAAIASGISLITFNLLMLLQVRFLLKMQPYNKRFLSPTLLAIIAFAMVLFIKSFLTNWTEIQRLLISAPLFVLAFALPMYKWGVNEEDRIVVDTIKQKLLKTIG